MIDIPSEIEKRVQDKILNLARFIGDQMVAQSRQVLKDANKNATGQLSQNIGYDVEQKVNQTIINVVAEMGYASYVHGGQKPHYPPMAPIMAWIEARGIKPAPVGNRKTAPSTYLLARMIVNKIATRGVPAFKFFEVAWDRVAPKVAEQWKS